MGYKGIPTHGVTLVAIKAALGIELRDNALS